MTSAAALMLTECRVRNNANLRLAPPCSGEMQVFGVVGRDDVRANLAAGHAPGENQGPAGFGHKPSRDMNAGLPIGPAAEVCAYPPDRKTRFFGVKTV
jgi:hypothetical protein